jgi:hypothetical protein
MQWHAKLDRRCFNACPGLALCFDGLSCQVGYGIYKRWWIKIIMTPVGDKTRLCGPVGARDMEMS